MNYLELDFQIEPTEGREICMAFLSQIPFETFQDSPNGFIAYIKKEDLDHEMLSLVLNDISGFKVTYSEKEIEQVNWNEEWEKNFEPIVINEQCVIRAPFHEDPKAQYDLIIMPKMSFGTGHHATTRLMANALLKEDLNNKKVMDAGCGTAVLAILAEKLRAKSVLAYDIDEWAVSNSIENIAVNNCKYIDVEKGSVHEIAASGFHVILANINKNVLLKELKYYSDKLALDGILFLSGFYESDIEDVANEAIAHGLAKEHSETLDEWAILKLRKNTITSLGGL